MCVRLSSQQRPKSLKHTCRNLKCARAFRHAKPHARKKRKCYYNARAKTKHFHHENTASTLPTSSQTFPTTIILKHSQRTQNCETRKQKGKMENTLRVPLLKPHFSAKAKSVTKGAMDVFCLILVLELFKNLSCFSSGFKAIRRHLNGFKAI